MKTKRFLAAIIIVLMATFAINFTGCSQDNSTNNDTDKKDHHGGGGGGGDTCSASNDNYSMLSDTVLSKNVTSNDDCNNGTVTLTSEPSAGTATLNSDGSLTYNPGGYTGEVNFTYKIDDGKKSDSATVTITVNEEGNHPPTCTISSSLTTAVAPANYTITVNCTDPEGDPLTYKVFENGNQIGTASVVQRTNMTVNTYQYYAVVKDPTNPEVMTSQITVTVTAQANNPPTISFNCPSGVNEDQATTCSITATDADVPAQTLTCSPGAGNTCTGMTLNGCTSVNIPAQGEMAPTSCTVSVTVWDNGVPAQSASASRTIQINEVNQNPTITVNCPDSVSESSATSCTLSVSDLDFPAQGLNCTASASTCTGVTLSGCSFANVPAQGENAPSSCTVVVTVQDSMGGTGSGQDTINITESNQNPVITSTCSTSATENVVYTCTFTGTDADIPTQALSWTKISDTCGGNLNGSNFTFTPTETQGGTSCNIGIQLSDNFNPAGTAVQYTTITIAEANQNPVITSTCAQTASEGTVYTCNFTGTDADIPAQLLTWTKTMTDTCAGTLNGSIYTFTPTETQGGMSCFIGIQLSDNFVPAGTAMQNTTVSITETNQTPTITVVCPASVNNNLATTCPLVVADPDLPTQTLTCSLAAGTTCTSVTLTGCSVANVPAQGASSPASCTVAVTVSDTITTATGQDSMTINPVGTNNPPTITCTINPNNLNPTAPATYDINCTATDPDPGDYVARVDIYENGNANQDFTAPFSLNRTNVVAGTYDYYGISYDSHNANSGPSAIIHVVVGGAVINHPPTITVTCPDNVAENVASTCAISATDPDAGQTLTCAVAPATTCAGVTLTGCSLANIPQQGEATGPGSCVVVVTVTDSYVPAGSATGQDTITINEVNLLPTITVDCPPSGNEGVNTTCALTVADGDLPAQTLTCSVNPATTCVGVTLTSCATANVPAQSELSGPGSCVVVVNVADSFVPAGTATGQDMLIINEVNTSPAIVLNCPDNVGETSSTSCTVTVADTDLPANNLICSIAPGNTCVGATLTGCSSVNVPAQGENAGPGSCNVIVTVNDNGNPNLSATAQDTILITEVNQAPTIMVDCPVSVAENAATTCAITTSDSDLPSQSLFCSVAPATTCSGVTLNGCTSANVPAQGENAGPSNCMVSINVIDNGVPSLNANGADVLTITEVNQAPTIVVDCQANVAETATGFCGITATDSDVPTNLLTCSLDPATTCTGAILSDCALVTVPQQGETAGPGACNVVVRVIDNGTPALNATGSDILPITEVNQNPTITVDCPANVSEGSPTTCGITTADGDLPVQGLTCTLAAGTTCTGVTLNGCTSANVPDQGETAGGTSCTVAVTVSDSFVPAGTATASDTIAVVETNSTPSIVVNCPATVDETAATWCALTATDPDLPPQTLTCSIAMPATTCTGATITNCASVQIPAQGEAAGPGSCTVAVTVVDSGSASATGSDTITINEVNSPPIAVPDTYNMDQNGELDIAAPGVMINDSDPDGDTLTAILDTQPLHGDLIFNADGSFYYLPDENYYGTDSFTYHVNDGLANSNVVSVTINIAPLPYLKIQRKYLNGVSAIDKVFSECGIQVDPETSWWVHCEGSGNNNVCTFPVDPDMLTYGSCEFSIHTPGQFLNGCDFNQNGTIEAGESDQWFPTGILDMNQDFSCSTLDTLDGTPPPAWVMPTVFLSRTGYPADEIQMGVDTIQYPWGWNYIIDLTEDGENNHNPIIDLAISPNSLAPIAPANYTITANPVDSDPGDYVDWVEFYEKDGDQVSLVSFDDTAPFSVNITNKPAGTYAYYAVAYDSYGISSGPSNLIIVNVGAMGANLAPTLNVDCPTSVAENATATCTVTASDADIPPQTLTCVLDGTTTCTGAALTGCTSVSIPIQGENAPGSCVVAVTVSDSGTPILSTTASDTITINEVNQAPTITVDCPANVSENATTTCAITTADADIPANGLTCALAAGNTCTGVTLTGCATANVPAQGEASGPGSCIVAVTVTDNGTPALNATGSDTITITEVNQAPTITVDCPANVAENATTTCAITTADADIPANGLTCALAAGNTCTGVTLTGCATANVPAQGEASGPGSCIVAVTVTDNGTPALNATGSDTITITEVNQAPAIVVDCPTNTSELSTTTCTLIVGDVDLPANTLTCTLAAGTTCTGATITGCTSVNVPAQGETSGPGSCVVAVTVNDNGVPPLNTTASDTIIINEVNATPTIVVDCQANVDENQTGFCGITVADTDVPANILTCSLAAGTTCIGAILSDCALVTIPFQGESAGPGNCTVAVTVTDSGIPALSATGNDTITINEVNQAPTISVDCPANVNETASTTCNITRADGDLPAQTLTCTLAGSTTCSGVTLTGCATANVPAQGEMAGPGSCIVAVMVTDSGLPALNATGSDTIIINEVNAVPTITVNCPANVNETDNTSCTIATADGDIPAQALTCNLTAGTTCAGATLNDCTSINVPAQGESAGGTSCAIAVTVTDNFVPAATATATDTIAIVETNATPGIIVSCPDTIIETSATTCSINATDPDIPAQALTCALAGTTTCIGVTLTGCTTANVPAQNNGPTSCVVAVAVTDNGIPPQSANGSDTILITENNTLQAYIVFEWAYQQPGNFFSSFSSNCAIPLDPLNPWEQNCNQTGNYNICKFALDPDALAAGYCEFSIHTPGSGLNTCNFNGNISSEDWFPAGSANAGDDYYCSALGMLDATPPPTIVFPTVGVSLTGSPANESQRNVEIANHPWGRNYVVDLTGIETNAAPIAVVNCPASVNQGASTSCSLIVADPQPSQTLTCAIAAATNCTGVTITGCTSVSIPAQGLSQPNCNVGVTVSDNGTPILDADGWDNILITP